MTPRHEYYEGIPRLGAAAVDTSRVILANSPLKTAFSRETEVIGAERAE